MMEDNNGSNVLTVKELSQYLKVCPSTIYRQLRQGTLPAFKVGSDWRFNIESIDRWRLDCEQGTCARDERGHAGDLAGAYRKAPVSPRNLKRANGARVS